MQDLKSRLAKRGISNPESIWQVVVKYNLEPNIRNFDSHGFILLDRNKRSVRIVNGSYENDVIHTPRINTDIAIIFVEEMLLGWIDSSDLIDADDIMILKTKSLQPMPDEFDFHRTCPHLEEFGGFLEGDYWECGGCGTLIKANVDGA